ncbi:CHAT domain-containing protein [Hymenobacter sp. BT635]|uniref:CHAT domain-containing protein n=1 Tax=Hymenobacter nitidus TaxID=2880929 RepID=A0ABS8AAW4_9BACT|nr:CHAT domain-containing protein [Hymenobacter nitidus]MCB2377077.1 CHAT domain-containing protein [Hymenobacter nitidus]
MMPATPINPAWPQLLLDLCQLAETPAEHNLPPDLQAKRDRLWAYYGKREYKILLELIHKNELLKPLEPGVPGHAVRGSLVLIPDFMGSELSVNGKPVWLDLQAITQGLQGLKVYHDVDKGKETDRPDPLPQVTVTGPSLRLYTRAVLTLARYWDVHIFAYDWRQSMDTGANALAAFLDKQHLSAGPLRLVAHGSGGLLARRFVQLHPTRWYPGYGAAQVNRLVLVGTPNEGTYWAVQLLSGTDKMVRWLDKLDLANSLPQVLRILNSFPATYELLPPRHALEGAAQEIYERGTWVPLPVRKHLLKKAQDFHKNLRDKDQPASLDPASMVAVMGCNQATIFKLETVSPGEFRYQETMNGDGRVAFRPVSAQGGPPAAPAEPVLPTYYIDETHGSLLANPLVLKSVDEIFRNQRTATLPARPIVTRTFAQREKFWHRPIGEDIAGSALEYLAERHSPGRSHPGPPDTREEYLAAEETLVRAAAGEANPTQRLDTLTRDTGRTTEQHKKITLRVLQQNICEVDTDLLMIGRYVGAPLTNRFLELDVALDSWIGRAIDRGLLSGELGKAFYLPRPATAGMDQKVKARAMLLLGMGEEGRYSHHDLRFLMSNASFMAASLGIRRFTAVVLGTRGRGGRGSLSETGALLSFIQGVAEGLDRCGPTTTDVQALDITLLARDEAQCKCQVEFFEQARATGNTLVPGLELDFQGGQCLPAAAPRAARPPKPPKDDPPGDLPERKWGPRITIEQEGTRYRFTALIDGAVIPVRELDVQPYFPSTLPGRLMESQMLREQETYGELMSTLLFPLDFQDYFDEPLTFVLDSNTAGLPWEMACFAQMQNRLATEGTPHSTRKSLSREMQLARQFRTMLSPKPGIPPPRNHSLRILIIADPAPEPHLQLPGARREGRAVVDILSTVKAYMNAQSNAAIKLDVVERIGEAECDFLEIMALILNGSFDVIHFAGHGVFDPKDPTQQGWVFGQGRVLTAREIFRARHVPRLVFANACFSSVVRKQPAFVADSLNGSLAGIAEAFFERGVRNYLGTGWPVNDEQALTFAREFYAQVLVKQSAESLLEGVAPGYADKKEKHATLGQAIAAARNAIYNGGGSTWGAYQHYGQATDYLLYWR